MLLLQIAASFAFAFAAYLAVHASSSAESWRERAIHAIGIAGVCCFGLALVWGSRIHSGLLLSAVGLMSLHAILDLRGSRQQKNQSTPETRDRTTPPAVGVALGPSDSEENALAREPGGQ